MQVCVCVCVFSPSRDEVASCLVNPLACEDAHVVGALRGHSTRQCGEVSVVRCGCGVKDVRVR